LRGRPMRAIYVARQNFVNEGGPGKRPEIPTETGRHGRHRLVVRGEPGEAVPRRAARR
jgi:hypothetical protein